MTTLAYPDTLTTGLLLVMPPEVQRIAVPLMSQYAPHSLQWVAAHLTLLVPFVPLDELPDACRKLREVTANIAPFDLALDGYGRFEGGAYMQPVNVAALHRLFDTIFATFPEYPPYGGEWGNDFDPHVSVALRLDPETEASLQLPDYAPINVQVDRFNVVYGSFETKVPFLTYDVIHLTG